LAAGEQRRMIACRGLGKAFRGQRLGVRT
jgi:hypothetical protein